MKGKHLYKASFICEIKCLHKKEKDKFLAQASLENIKDFLPEDIDFERNEDLIAFAANGTVVNRGNKNGHLIDAETATKVHKLFKYKFLDVEHNRDHIVGVITNTGFSSYDKNTLIASKDVKGSKDPLYLTVGGVVYRNVNKDFAEKLEESSDPESELYRKISLSWEIMFSSYYLLIGDKNLSEGEIVKDPEKIEEYAEFLSFNGGNNKLEDGTPIYTVVSGEDVLPMGFGFTLSPAAEVEGVLLESEILQDNEEEGVEATASKKNKSSLPTEQHVNIHKTPYTHMEIKSKEDFYQNWNEIRANESAPSLDFIWKKLQEASENYSKEVEAKTAESTARKAEVEKLNSTVEILEKTLEEQKASLQILEDEKKAQEQQAQFQVRMNVIDEEYELDEETSAIVASKIKGLSEEDFISWKKEFDVLAREKSKTFISKHKEEEKAARTNALEANAKKEKEDQEKVAKEALANAKEKKEEKLPNGSPSLESVREAWNTALKEGVVIEK
jgi:hypothetical protein